MTVGVFSKWLKTAQFYLAWHVDPREMAEVGIGRNTDHVAVKFFKLLNTIRKGDQLSWADEGKVKWVEEKNEVFSEVILE